jgi:hypothetical protein
MNFNRILLTAFLGLFLVGCAHPIKISPDMSRLEPVSTAQPRLTTTAGYYIPPEVESVEVTTQGGGGDNVRYYPYRDMAAGFHKMLSNVFASVVKLASPTDKPTLDREGINYVIVPTMVTTSGGSGFFTWPPTNFSVDLTSQIRNAEGKLIASPRVVGIGDADTAERLSEHGIAGRRAMEDALLKMQSALFETNFNGQFQTLSPAAKSSIVSRRGADMSDKDASASVIPPSAQGQTTTTQPVETSAVRRLRELSELRKQGLITESEYNQKRQAILSGL